MEVTMKVIRYVLCLISLCVIAFTGCETLKTSKPIVPIKEYERMIVGRFDANYIGTESCLPACHYHDDKRRDFEASTMGAQLSKKSGMPLVNCESCHGPGSLAVEGITKEIVENDAQEGKQTECKYDTLIDLKKLPAQAKSLICLKCHTANATFNLHNWNAGAHNVNDVSCSDCHNIHMGPDLTVRKEELENMCQRCHEEVKAEFTLPSHHPVQEKQVFCTGCHDAHGSISDKMLTKSTIKETCTTCHADKEGPFVFEHADNTEDCSSCHSPHGSVNNFLLNVRVPFLCLQCHAGHRTSSTSAAESKVTFYTRCTDCHSQIHGTDLPSPSGLGTFIQ
jgi:DmsE family decaheme c-type cytochrome